MNRKKIAKELQAIRDKMPDDTQIAYMTDELLAKINTATAARGGGNGRPPGG